MNEDLQKIIGKKIVDIKRIYDKGELWQLQFIFDDNSQFNVYMCLNVEHYMDYDYLENLL